MIVWACKKDTNLQTLLFLLVCGIIHVYHFLKKKKTFLVPPVFISRCVRKRSRSRNTKLQILFTCWFSTLEFVSLCFNSATFILFFSITSSWCILWIITVSTLNYIFSLISKRARQLMGPPADGATARQSWLMGPPCIKKLKLK